jgi:hypothetical protein
MDNETRITNLLKLFNKYKQEEDKAKLEIIYQQLIKAYDIDISSMPEHIQPYLRRYYEL